MKYKYLQTDEAVDQAIKDLYTFSSDLIGCDTEGTGLDRHTAKLRLIQISLPNITYLFDIFKVPKSIPLLKQWFETNKERKVTTAWHNAKYDIQMLWKVGIDLTGQSIFDTFLAVKILEAGLDLEAGLGFVCERYLGHTLDKTEQKSDWGREQLTKEQLDYSAKDANSTRELAHIFKRKLVEENLMQVFTLELGTLFCSASMEFFGTRVSKEKLDTFEPVYVQRTTEAEDIFLKYIPDRWIKYDLFGNVLDKGFKVSSPAQVIESLQKLGVPDPLPDDKGKPQLIQKTASTHIKLLDIVDYPVLEALLAYKKTSKLYSGFIKGMPDFINPVTGRIHPSINQMVSTGRFSLSEPNMQQLPRPTGDDYTLRKLFVPEEGNVFVSADYSQIELRVIAELLYVDFGDDVQLLEFVNNLDPYVATAAILNHRSYEDLKALELTDKSKYKKDRQNAKAVRLGLNYAMGAPKLRNYAKTTYGVSMTPKEAEEYRKRYFTIYSALEKYHKKYNDRRIKAMYTFEPYKRRRLFPEFNGVGGLVNAPIQGTSADITKLAMAKLYIRLHKLGYSPTQSHDIMPILTIHDELIVECKEELKELAKELVESCMVEAGQKVLKHCPVEAEAKYMMDLSQKD